MNLTFADMLNEFIIAYFDNVLVYSETQKEHLMHLREVFERNKSSILCCKLKKYDFGKDDIKYLGYKIVYHLTQVFFCIVLIFYAIFGGPSWFLPLVG